MRAGTEEPVILDCQYSMDGSTNQALVVKWYVNDELLYQWIHGSAPKGSEEFQQYVDTTYKADTNKDMEYRAVKLVRPSHDLSGKVRCSISSLDSEDEAVGELLVYCEYYHCTFMPLWGGGEFGLKCTFIGEHFKSSWMLEWDKKALASGDWGAIGKKWIKY